MLFTTQFPFLTFDCLYCIVNTTPLLKDLYRYITPNYAADWKVLGTLLDLNSRELRAIEGAYPTNLNWCCNKMLEKWLEVDPYATWKKILEAIDSPAISSGDPLDQG